MFSFWSFLLIVHLIGLALCVGSATAKILLLLKCNRDYKLVPDYLKVAKLLTQLIVLGMILITLSGIIWLILGYGFTTLLIVKLIFVGLVWVIGPFIDNIIEPKFRQLASASGEAPTQVFIQVQKKYLVLEVIATLLFYTIVVLGVLL